MPDGTVFQIVSDGAGNLYAGGTFTSASGVSGTSKIAKWDGASWTALGKGVSASTNGVFAVGVDTAANPDVVYVGGDITQVKKADNTTVAVNWTAKFDSTNDWSALATASGNGVVSTSDPDDAVEEIALSGQTAYLAGRFDGVTGDGTPQDNFAKFSSGTLSEVASSSETNYYVNGLTIDGSGNPILAGQFTGVTDAGGQETFRRVAKWDVASSRWVGFGTGPSGPFNNIAAAVAADGSDVFVGGNFTKVQNNNADVAATNGLAMWDDSASSWVSIGSVGGTVVEELRVISHTVNGQPVKYLYAGGTFNSIGGVRAINIARMNLATPGVWEPLTVGCENGVNDAVRSIIDAGGGAVYVAGRFTNAGGVAAADRIAKFTPGAAQACGGSVLLSSPTDFKIARVDDAKKKVAGAWGLYVTLAWQSSGPLPPLYFKVTVDRAEDTVKGAGTSWSVISSHPEMDCWTTQLSCTIFMPYSFYGGFGLSEAKFTLYGYSFNGSSTPLSIDPPDPDAPTIPPGAPTNVVATALERAVRVTWTKPADQGTYPITNYLVRATPSGRVCISRMTDPVLEACTFTGLTPGVNYTFKVQGLNGAGWGQYSSVSNAAASVALEITKSSRNRRTFLRINLGSTVTFDGVAPGTPANTPISVWAQWIDSSGRPVSNWEPQPGVRTNSSGKFSFRANFPRARNGQRMIVKVQTAGTCFTSGKYQPCVYQSQEVTLRSV
jgi:hypothetical protein